MSLLTLLALLPGRVLVVCHGLMMVMVVVVLRDRRAGWVGRLR